LRKKEALRLLFARGNKQFHDDREQVSSLSSSGSQSTRLTTTGRTAL
jgi:hypothetical protein